jgi:hypothetical protein
MSTPQLSHAAGAVRAADLDGAGAAVLFGAAAAICSASGWVCIPHSEQVTSFPRFLDGTAIRRPQCWH